MVRQVRVIRNTLVVAAIFILLLWKLQGHVVENIDALLIGILAGGIYALFYWRGLSRRITRKNKRYESNKIFVRFISVFEVLLAVAASGHYVLIGMAVVILIAVIFDYLTGHWWAVLGSGLGMTSSAVLTIAALWYEKQHGPLYYQYDSRMWLGGEGMLYQVGEVQETLSPSGLVTVNGELWKAISKSGEPIEKGERIEVISRTGLILHVDRATDNES